MADCQSEIAFTAIVDGCALTVALRADDADTSTLSRALAALLGTMQALEDGSWTTRSPRPTAAPSTTPPADTPPR